jgi:DNA primase
MTDLTQDLSEQPDVLTRWQGRVRLIRTNVDIVRIARRYVKLSKQGELFVGQCPLCAISSQADPESTPLFIISQKHREFYCFGCKRNGDIIHFVMRVKGLQHGDATEYLERNYLSSPSIEQET